MFHNSLFDRFFGRDGINPFGSPFKLEKYLLEVAANAADDVEEETFEVVKGDYKTLITCKFNKKGYMVSHSIVSEYIPSKEEEQLNVLETELKKALDREDYREAVKIQEKKKKFEETLENKKKPTL